MKKQTEVQETEARKVGESTLEALIDYFNARANEADELVDAGFLKMRTDVFRLGNLLLDGPVHVGECTKHPTQHIL